MAEVTRGVELVAEFDAMAEQIRIGIIKFFDKGQKVSARRCRGSLSEMGKFAKATRKEISELKAKRAAAVNTDA
jgi:hypothetical protein